MSESDSDTIEYASSDDGSDFEGFTAADIRESERSVAASATNTSDVGVVGTGSDSSDSSDSESDEVNISYAIVFSSARYSSAIS